MAQSELLYEALKDLVSEEQIANTVNRIVVEKMESYAIEKAIQNTVFEIVKEKADGYIQEQVDEIMHNPVRLDDGWGNIKEEGSFEDYVRRSLRKQCFDQWKLERKLREVVDEKLKNTAKKIVDKHLEEDLVGEVLQKLKEEI